MEENIFEGAKYGDKFKANLTKNENECALYSHKYKSKDGYKYILYSQFGGGALTYNSNGECCKPKIYGFNIVSRYQEPIDEEKLDKLASKHIYKTNYFTNQDSPLIPYYAELCYKAGYRKAKEE